MKALQSSLLLNMPGVHHSFGTRAEPLPETMRALWEARRPVWRQVHGKNFARVEVPGQHCGEVDALWTSVGELPIAVLTADCVPILLCRKDGRVGAVVHAGWRGTQAQILQSVLKEFQAQGEKTSNWVAAVGPAIGPCCYEVSETLACDFERTFSEYGPLVAVPSPRRLDLPAINAEMLRRMGVSEVDLLRACTQCTLEKQEPAWHSFRRDGATAGRQISLLSLGRSQGTLLVGS